MCVPNGTLGQKLSPKTIFILDYILLQFIVHNFITNIL